MNNNELESLQQSLTTLYLKNMTFLQKNFQELFKKIELLAKKLEEEERYTLEFKEEGYFDIYDKKTESFLYGFNSYLEADIRFEKVNFSTEHSINLLRMDPDTNKFALMEQMEENLQLVEYLNQKINFNEIRFDKIYKFMFIGTGLGVHINEIDKKIKPMNTLIIEPNLEIFRLSLFLLDLEVFTKGERTLFLSINESKNELFQTLSNFSNTHSYMNHTIKHHLFKYDYKYILDQTIDYFAVNNPISFRYNSMLSVTARTLKFMKKGYPFLQKKLLDKYQPLKNKKVLTISAGPSLDKHMPWIINNQEKFVIVCVDVILRKLEKNNIKPDIVVSIDPYETCAKYLITDDENFLDKSSIICLSQQHPTTIKVIENKNFFFSQVYPIANELGYSLTFSNVGAFSFFISILLGASEVYLTGCDAAFNQETGSRYASDSSHTQSDINDKESIENFISSTDIVETKGNLKDKVKTNRELLQFKESYEEFIHTFNLKGTYYNLSHGAYIEGLKPLDIENINIKELSKESFNKNLLEKSSVKVNIPEIEEDRRIIDNIIKKVIKFKEIEFKNKNDFLKQKNDITLWILQEKKILKISMIESIFMKFLDYIDIYLNFTFNLDQKSIYKKETYKKISIYWSDSLITLLKNMKKIIDFSSNNIEIEEAITKINEFKFNYSLLSVNKYKIVEKYTKNVIGFFASKENLEDNNFIKYIESLYKNLQNVSFTVFYFNRKEKEHLETKLPKRTCTFNLVTPKNIYDIGEKVDIFLGLDYTISKDFTKSLLYFNKNIILIYYPSNKDTLELKLNEVGNIVEDEYEILKELGVDKENIERYKRKFIIASWQDFFSKNKITYNLDHTQTYNDYLINILDLCIKNQLCREYMRKSIYTHLEYFKYFE